LIDIKNLEQFKALRTRDLQRRDDSTWFTNIGYIPTMSEGLKLVNYLPSKSNDQSSCLRSMAFEAFQSDSMDTKVLNEDSIVVSDQALTACFSWLTNSELFVTMDSQNRAAARDNLMLQLREVDSWLRRHGGPDALCSALNMIKDLQSLSPLATDAENVADPDGSPSLEQDEPTTPKRKPLAEMRMIDPGDDSRPTWIRCNRKWLAPETANHYNLPWEFDRVKLTCADCMNGADGSFRETQHTSSSKNGSHQTFKHSYSSIRESSKLKRTEAFRQIYAMAKNTSFGGAANFADQGRTRLRQTRGDKLHPCAAVGMQEQDKCAVLIARRAKSELWSK
jgi:hypothetical protein